MLGGSNPEEVYLNIKSVLTHMLEHENIQLPMLPEVADEILRMVNHEEVDFNKITMLIKKDQFVSTRMIAVANSPLYASTYPVNKVEDVVRRLGLEEVKRIALSISLSAFNIERGRYSSLFRALWQHSIACGLSSQKIAQLIKYDDVAISYLAGLIHDIGRAFVLLVMFDIEKYIGEPGFFGPELLRTVSMELHEDFGGFVSRKWQLPENLHSVIINHHDEDNLRGKTLEQIVHAADLLSSLLGYGDEFDNDRTDLYEACGNLGISEEDPIKKEEYHI